MRCTDLNISLNSLKNIFMEMTHPMGVGVDKDDFPIQIWIFHAILTKNCCSFGA